MPRPERAGMAVSDVQTHEPGKPNFRVTLNSRSEKYRFDVRAPRLTGRGSFRPVRPYFQSVVLPAVDIAPHGDHLEESVTLQEMTPRSRRVVVTSRQARGRVIAFPRNKRRGETEDINACHRS
jgi:hypothetical protein